MCETQGLDARRKVREVVRMVDMVDKVEQKDCIKRLSGIYL